MFLMDPENKAGSRGREPWCTSLGVPWGGAPRPEFAGPAPASESESSQALSHCTCKIFTLKTPLTDSTDENNEVIKSRLDTCILSYLKYVYTGDRNKGLGLKEYR